MNPMDSFQRSIFFFSTFDLEKKLVSLD